ncbi:MAG: nitroreductase family protein [Thermomicrobiales bacterium]
MAIDETIRTMLAVRAYDDRPLPEGTAERLLGAARLTGSSMNGQPWHYVVVQERETLQRIGELMTYGPYIAQAPLAIAVVIDQTPYAVSDASRAIQDMLLTAWEEGIGSNWVGFGDSTPGSVQVKALLGIPEELTLLAVVPFGYPAQAVGQGQKKRKPLSEIAYRERWGAPFA